jgi:hypothetical protein
MGIPTIIICAIIISHCHADHDAGAFHKILDDSRVEVIMLLTYQSRLLLPERLWILFYGNIQLFQGFQFNNWRICLFLGQLSLVCHWIFTELSLISSIPCIQFLALDFLCHWATNLCFSVVTPTLNPTNSKSLKNKVSFLRKDSSSFLW